MFTIMSVHPVNLSIEGAGVVDLIQARDGGEAGSWESTQWVDMETIEDGEQRIGHGTAEQETSNQGHLAGSHE